MRVLITETNVDGCGDYAQTLVQFPKNMFPSEINLFKSKLADIKANAAKNDLCLDTDDMVKQALLEFGQGGEIIPMANAFLEF